MRDPFNYPLNPMTPEQAQANEKERQAQASWKKTSTFFLVLVCVVYIFMMYGIPILNTHQEKDLGGEPGIIQDGVYYIYGGGGPNLSNESKTPIGLCAYTPGQEPEVLVSAKEYDLNTVFPSWDVNSHGLYFMDRNTNTLYRMDLATREIAPLYALPEPPKGSNPYIFPNGLWEDRIALICHDGISDYHLVLDCRTGEVLSREEDKDQITSWNLVAGERILTQCQADYPEGTEYPGWERDLQDNLYYYTDLRENGVSVLPQGHKLEEVESRAIGDAILVISHPFEDMGDWTVQLFLADGRTLDLPLETEEVRYNYLAVSDQWLFYTSGQEDGIPETHKRIYELWAMDLNTMESYLVSQEYAPYYAVTDGNWFYSYGDTTDCYQLEYNDQGIPCGLKLMEEHI